MPGSGAATGNDLACTGGGAHYVFASQRSHDCLFYGTQTANDAVVAIANQFYQRQLDCRAPHIPSAKCDVTLDDGVTKIPVIISSLPVKITITAMSLPWGGLNDIGPSPNCIHWLQYPVAYTSYIA